MTPALCAGVICFVCAVLRWRSGRARTSYPDPAARGLDVWPPVFVGPCGDTDPVHDYTRLEVWKRARSTATRIYALTESMPETERFGLQSQMRRSAVSIASNIAEGSGRSSPKDFARFLEIASGSAAELETQLIVASDVGLLDQRHVGRMVEDLRSLRGSINALRGRRQAAQ